MKVILLQDLSNLGKRGDIKEVANVYAINVLIPQKKVVEATPAEIAKWKQKEDVRKYQKEFTTKIFSQLLEKLRHEQIIISGKKHDEKGQLFAQVKEGDIADAIFKVTNFSIDTKQIIVPKPIKSLGTHTVELKQGAQKENVVISIV